MSPGPWPSINGDRDQGLALASDDDVVEHVAGFDAARPVAVMTTRRPSTVAVRVSIDTGWTSSWPGFGSTAMAWPGRRHRPGHRSRPSRPGRRSPGASGSERGSRSAPPTVLSAIRSGRSWMERPSRRTRRRAGRGEGAGEPAKGLHGRETSASAMGSAVSMVRVVIRRCDEAPLVDGDGGRCASWFGCERDPDRPSRSHLTTTSLEASDDPPNQPSRCPPIPNHPVRHRGAPRPCPAPFLGCPLCIRRQPMSVAEIRWSSPRLG